MLYLKTADMSSTKSFSMYRDPRMCSGQCVDGSRCTQTYATSAVGDLYYCYHHVDEALDELRLERRIATLQREREALKRLKREAERDAALQRIAQRDPARYVYPPPPVLTDEQAALARAE